ncbi:MAG TPA: 3-hydroxyacyl-CoA dehydrogenase NAD-binding domain-containing protein [Gemmatimonadaceae bacterium]|nr:3-hydroxyacyl-CoA dehydrogenase NAD-binding domain-containing protein [Gemmatimonadaceae bacterium]
MTELNRGSKVGVIGAGAMGSGIAQVAAAWGHQVILFDTQAGAVDRAIAGIEKNLARSVEKARLSTADAGSIRERILTVDAAASGSDDLSEMEGCALVIEAIVENLEAKRELFSRLENMVSADTLLATNTSSLSVTAIARACTRPERVIGIHFFNPPTVLPLVEIVPGLATSSAVTQGAASLVEAWGKTPVIAADTPGFIVNRIARPFYGEALRIYEEGIADMATIDWAMREIGGFRMGPFELMDFIGNDVNFTATKSVYEATFHDPRFRPTLTQQRLFDAGFFGRKSGRGYYDYSAGATMPEPNRDPDLGQMIFRRILSMLINQAADALYLRIASAHDIDLAMTQGVNYPKGLLAWADELGIPETVKWLGALQDFYGEERYRASPLLKTMAADGFTFFSK